MLQDGSSKKSGYFPFLNRVQYISPLQKQRLLQIAKKMLDLQSHLGLEHTEQISFSENGISLSQEPFFFSEKEVGYYSAIAIT